MTTLSQNSSLHARLQADVETMWHLFHQDEPGEARAFALSIRHRAKQSGIALTDGERFAVATVIGLTEKKGIVELLEALCIPTTRKAWREFGVGMALVVLFVLALAAVNAVDPDALDASALDYPLEVPAHARH